MTLEEIRKLADAATPGPWSWNSYSFIASYTAPREQLENFWDGEGDMSELPICRVENTVRGRQHGDETFTTWQRANAEFIAASRTLVPFLVDALDLALANCDPKVAASIRETIASAAKY